MSFCARNFGAFLLAQVIVGLMFAAIFTDWYSWTTNYTQKGGTVNSNALQGVTNTLTLNYSNIYFNTTGFRTIIRTSAQTTANVAAVTVYSTWGNTNGAYSKVASFFNLVLAFSIIALIIAGFLSFNLLLLFFSPCRNYYIKACGMSTLRWLLGGLVFGIWASNVISLLGFLGVTAAFSSDLTSTCNDGPCRIYSGSATAQFGDGIVNYYANWGPDAGWYVTIASVVISTALFFAIATLRFPIPYDTDDSSGEAL